MASKKPVNGRRKGSAFELKMKHEFTQWTGVKWEKTILSGGGLFKGDIAVVDGASPWLVELKNREEFTYHQIFEYKDTAPLWKWWKKLRVEQVVMKGKPIMLIAKANRKPAIMIVDNEIGNSFLKTRGIKFHGSLFLPDNTMVHYFMWDEVREKVKVEVTESKPKKVTKRKKK